MANVSRINGFKPVKYLSGMPYTGEARLYYVASAGDEMYVNDPVKLAGSADANGIATVDLAGAADKICGIIVGVMHSKFDPVGKMNSGSTALDYPSNGMIAVSGAAYVMVADSPQLIMEAETSAGTPAVENVGLNASHALGTRSATVYTSPATLDMSTEDTTSTLNFRILGFVQRVGNEVAASAKMLVAFNAHQYGSVGTTGL